MFKAHASQTFDCSRWFFYLLELSSSFELNFFPCFIFHELHLKKTSWINPCQRWLQVNETNAMKKAFALRVIETVEREGLFEFIWEINTLKNMVDSFK